MKIIRTIEMTKRERDVLDKIINDFSKSSITSEYCFGQAIEEMINNDKYSIKDFKIKYDDMSIIKRALNWFWFIPDESLGSNVAEFMGNLAINDFDGYEVKIIL